MKMSSLGRGRAGGTPASERRNGGAPPAATFVLALAVLGVGACAKQPVFLPSRDLDRPTDVAFSCIAVQSPAGSDTKIVGAQPMDACHPPGAKDPLVGQVDANGTQYKTFAFLPNSERGDVSVIDMSYCRSNDDSCRQRSFQPGAALVDLDPNTIGYGGVPVGELPEVIAASQDGCRLMTANRGSCDLTLLDPAALLAPRLVGQPLGTFGKTFMVRTGSGQPLPVSPGEISFVPQQTNVGSEARGPALLCDATGTLAAPVGMPPATPQARASWHAVITFPSCDLVALVDVQTETILDSYRVRPGRNAKGDATDVTFFHTGADPVCPRIDCGPGAGTTTDAGTTVTQPVTDDAGAAGTAGGGTAGETGAGGAGGSAAGGAGGAGGSSTGGDAPVVTLDDTAQGLQVRPLAIRPEGTRVYFGATNWSAVGALDVAGPTLSVPPMGAITPLYDTRGVTRLRLSVDPYAYVNGHLPKPASGPDANDPTRPELGRFVARTDTANLQYLYAIARDASLRILDVSRPDPKECDLGIDPSAVPAGDPRRKCFPFGASDNPPRLPQAIYRPGLRFPSAPQDVAFAYYWTQPSTVASDQAVNEQILNGAFGFVLTGGGGLFILNVDPEPRLTAKVYYVVSDPDSTQRFLDVEPADATGLNPVGGLRVESPLPLPNSQRDPNVITFSSSLQPTVGPARPDPSPLFTSNGPLLKSFFAKTTRENATIVPLLSNGTWTAPPASSSAETFVFFPNPVTVVPQTWTIAWEPNITGTRNSGDLDRSRGPKVDPSGLAFALTDSGGSFCNNGIFPGDTVTLTGCTTDGNCGPGRVCVHSTEAPASASGYPINGLCMKRSSAGDADVIRRCGPLLRSFRRYEIQPTTAAFSDAFKNQSTPQSTLVLLPKKAERPVVGKCGSMCSRPDSPSGSIANFACEPDGVNEGRCLLRCDGDGGVPDDHKCAIRTGSVCVDFRATDGHFYCSDGAPLSDAVGVLDDVCGLDQLVPYDVWAGRSFVVAGTAVGRSDPGAVVEVREPSDGAAGGAAGGAPGAGGAGGGAGGPATRGTGYYQCVPDRSTPGVVARIPLDLPRCASPKLTSFGLAPPQAGETPYLAPNPGALKAVFTDSTVPTPNPCLIEYGPDTSSQDATGAGGAGGAMAGAGGAGGATAPTAGPTYSALFQNREIRFVLTNLETTTGDTVQLRLGVNGGSVGQQVAVAVDSAIGLPARVVVGPVPSADQTVDPPVPLPVEAGYLPSDLPYLFVIDQRTSAGGRLASRGQILRIAPRIADTAPMPGYQSGQTSNSYFPIQ